MMKNWLKNRLPKKLPLKSLLLQVLLLLLLLLLPNEQHPFVNSASILGAAALLGGASLLGSAMSSSSQNKANELNQQNFREQMDFSKYQYANAKTYNSALAQANRARAAGFNPLLAMDNLNSTASPVAVPSANPQQAVDYSKAMTGASQMASALTMGEQSESVINKNNADAAKSLQDSIGTSIDNQTRGASNIVNLQKLGFERDSAGFLANLQQNTLASKIIQENYQAEIAALNAENLGLQNEAAQINNAFATTEHWANIKNILADTQLKLAHKQIDFIQARAAMKTAVAAETNSLKQDGYFISKENQSKLEQLVLDKLASGNYSNWLNPKARGALKGYGFGIEAETPFPTGWSKAARYASD